MPGPGRRFQPGQSGNPGGQPKGTRTLKRYALMQTRQGRELIDQALAVLRGKDSKENPITQEVVAKGEVVEIGPSLRDKAEARQWLADRIFGKSAPAFPESPEEGDGKPSKKAPLNAFDALTPPELRGAAQVIPMNGKKDETK